jgi:hypothetical protein
MFGWYCWVPLKIKSNKGDHARTGRHFHGVGCSQGCMTVRSSIFAPGEPRGWVRSSDFVFVVLSSASDPRLSLRSLAHPERRQDDSDILDYRNFLGLRAAIALENPEMRPSID